MRGATLAPADYAALPQFAFREPPLGGTLARALPALAMLLALTLLLGGVALRRLRRFPVA
jgi:hypothetical protein